MSTNTSSLLHLLQIANSSFPTGAFNHSFGFETWINDGSISDGSSFEQCCRDWLLHGIARSDGAAVALAYRAASESNLKSLLELDEKMAAIKLARETREASSKTGRAMLKALLDIFQLEQLADLANSIAEKKCEGHQSVVFGAGAAMLKVSEHEAVLAFLQSSFANLVGVGSRIIPLGQVESQRIILNAGSLLLTATSLAQKTKANDFGSSTIGLDIASMNHERLYSRLCMS